MSKQNKVNPGRYTQRGRLTQDDAAREFARQRSIGSQHTWQPVKKDMMSRPAPRDEDGEAPEDAESKEAKPSTGNAKPAARMSRTTGTTTEARAKSKRSRAAKTSTAKKTTGKAKTGMALKPAAKTTAPPTVRTAVLARNTGGGALKPSRAMKRRKS